MESLLSFLLVTMLTILSPGFRGGQGMAVTMGGPAFGPTSGRPRSTMRIPETRGPLSSALFAVLAKAPDGPGTELDGLHRLAAAQVAGTGDIIGDEDIQLTLFCLYELHYSGLDGVSDDWEW